MDKKSKVIGSFLLVLAALCIGMYFLYGNSSREYSVLFDSDGGTAIPEQVVKKGEKVVKPTDPTKEDNDFVEWQLDGKAYNFNSEVTSKMTLKAVWKPYNSFSVKVTIDSNEYNTKIRENELLTIDALSIPTKEGYAVKLYSADNKEYDLKTPVTADLVLTGKYVQLSKYTVKFDSNGGNKVSDVSVYDGDVIAAPTVTRDGYKLDGWYLGETKFDFSTPITKNITLKARWNDGTTYNVTFMVDGTTYKTSPTKENTKVAKPNNPTKKGYKFVEWQLNGIAFSFDTKITKDITLTAKFEEATTYTVTFNSNGGSAVNSQEVESKATKPNNPTRKGYRFVEWQLNGKAYDFNKEVVEDITLKAIWKREYTVVFDSKGGTSIANQAVVEGEKITKPSNPTKSGAIFEEWLNNNKTFDFDKAVTSDMADANGNITLTARYKVSKTYTVTFDSDGGSSVPSQTVVEGETARQPGNPTKDGNEFVGWQLGDVNYNFSTPITKDITLKAKWQEVENSNPDILPTADN